MPELPDELWLHILSFLSPRDKWTCFRSGIDPMANCAEERIAKHGDILSDFRIGLTFSLGAGTRHRWYDVRGTITFTFKRVNKHNPQYALFGTPVIHPPHATTRALERWRRMSSEGMGQRQEWRVEHGVVEGEVKMLRLPKFIVADEGWVFCDWHELCDTYFSDACDSSTRSNGHITWSTDRMARDPPCS